ncbi:HMT-3 [Symbiodinium pilosum]|uniref:HMT-3 protein n=1 Tax=Symbiodinium pilosum TaxID=2952 RepID=A0A812WC52_SYMPI|nr:HMT-3 [Symbiodinium pilosum]
METTAPAAKRPRKEFKDPLATCRGTSKVLILDGGLATHIEALGEDIDHSLWSARCLVKNPSVIKQAHADYYEAGAAVAITASYQAHFDGFRELGFGEEEAVSAMKRSVQLAREVAPPNALVAGSVGSYGASLHNGAEYTGDFPGMDEEKLIAWHRPRAKALVEAGCDVLACETVPCLLEARSLVCLLNELQHPAWVTFSCKSDSEVHSGDTIADCVAAVGACDWVVGAGVNCTHPNFVSGLVRRCREVLPAAKSVVVYPNSGEVWNGTTHTWETCTATADEQFVEMAREWLKLGANCIGGCCRTGPATIAALKRGLAQ